MQVLFTPRFPLDTIAPARDDLAEPALSVYRHARGRYMQLMADVVEGPFRAEADVEDWYENVAWLFAALDAGLPVHVLDRAQHDGRDVRPVLSFGQPYDPDSAVLHVGAHPKRSRLLGGDPTQAGSPLCWPRPEHEHAANRYPANPAFARLAGRRIALCDIPGEGRQGDVVAPGADGEIAATLRDWAAAGPVDALIKVVVGAKYGPLVPVTLPAGADLEAARAAVFSALDYTLVHLEGVRSGLLLQDRIEMADEYRLFVVGGKPVTGAGCIEAFTPCDRMPGETFDPRLEARRGSGDRRVDRERVHAYRRFAETAARDLRTADPALGDFVLDLASAPDGTPLVVELNPIAPSGLYACKIDALMRAVRDSLPAREAVPAFA